MNNLSTSAVINWESGAVLSQIATKISKPLKEIIRLSKHLQAQRDGTNTNHLSAIMLESSEQIEALVTDILRVEQEKLIRVVVQDKFKYPNLIQFQVKTVARPSTRLLTQREEGNPRRISKADLEWLIQLESKVLDNLNSPCLCLSWLAEELAVSERQLFRKIEKYIKLTPNRYIRNLRLHRAKTLLEEYSLRTINEVALAVGIRDPYYFSKLFEAEFGKKPKAYLR